MVPLIVSLKKCVLEKENWVRHLFPTVFRFGIRPDFRLVEKPRQLGRRYTLAELHDHQPQILWPECFEYPLYQ